MNFELVKSDDKILKTPCVDFDFTNPPFDPIEFSSHLSNIESQLIAIKRSEVPCLAYGAGLVGLLLNAYLGAQLLGFIDDNPSLIGSDIEGKPVFALDDLKIRDSFIVVSVPPASTERVTGKLQQKKLVYKAPFLPFPNGL